MDVELCAFTVKYCRCCLLKRMVTQPRLPPLCDCREATVPALCNLPTADKGHTHLREGNQPSLSSRLTPRWRETLRRQLQMSGRRWTFTFSNYLELLCDWNCAIRTQCLHLGVSPSNKLSLNLLMQSTNQYKKDRKGKFSWEIQMTNKYKKKSLTSLTIKNKYQMNEIQNFSSVVRSQILGIQHMNWCNI